MSIAYPSSLLTVTNIYDAGRNLVTVRQIGGTNTIFFQAGTFNEFGQIGRINYGNGVSTTNEFWATTKRLKTLVTFKGTTNHQFLSYKYDRADNITNIADTVYTTNASAALAAVYDDLHRLTRVVRPIGTNSYAYTAIGNVVTNGESGTAAYTYGSLLPQAVRSVGGSLYAYDANGNMTVRAGQRLSYDAWNRLARVSTNNQPITAFGYGGDGSRIWKQAGTNLQVWIGNTYEEKQGKQLCQIFAGTRRIATYDSANSLQTGTNFTTLYYYHGDHLGSSSLLTDHAGNRVEHYEYSAFGRENFNDPAQSFAISQRFTGQVLDEETGLYLYGPRYYDPALARFIQPDTVIPSLFDPQSWNRYSYTLNNPLRYVDPSGHEAADYLGEWFAQLRSGRRLDQWASGMGRGFKSFGDAQAFLRSQKDPNGLSEDVALRREQAEGIAVGAKAASALTDAYVNTAPDIASGGIKTGVALGTKAFVSHMGEAPGMMSKVKGWFAKSAAAELPAAGGAVRRFKSFDSFKTALGPAGEGQVWHHIVEQRAANVEKFGAEAIHNIENVINVSRELNQQIANFYSTKQRFSGDQTVRQWLGKQSYEQQREFGIKTIREFSAAAEK